MAKSRYTINNMQMIGVTSVLGQLDKPALIPWAVNLCGKYIEMNYHQDMTIEELEELVQKAIKDYREVSTDAMDTGTKIHHLIEKYIKDKVDPSGDLKDEVANGFIAFLEWEEKNIDEYIETEQPVFNLDLMYAGTLDCVARMKDGKVMVIDWKSSKGFYDGYSEQVSAYKVARENLVGTHQVTFNADSEEESFEKEFTYKPIKIDGCGVLRLDKVTGIPEWKDYTKVQNRKYKSFCNLLDFYYDNKKRQLKNNPRVKKDDEY